MKLPLLKVENLKVHFHTREGVVKAVDDVSFEIGENETLCVVGESGCGKSVTALSIIGLISKPGRIESGKILFEDVDLTKLKSSDLRRYRGSKITMIFQEPMTSLNPSLKVGFQIAELLFEHFDISKNEAKERAVEYLKRVGIPDPIGTYDKYPHQLSGGMRQRVMIAMALIANPKLLIADEPTTALDVTIQLQILELIKELKESLGTSVMLITHDMGVVANMADKVVVMYAGKVVEKAGVFDIFSKPLHPYTQGLLGSIPKLDTPKSERLISIPGNVPRLINPPSGCRFHERCYKKMDICEKLEPPEIKLNDSEHTVSCWLYAEKIPKIQEAFFEHE
jgi:oligopeptide/dipeptide ABC transporter ATP-binding protein